MEDSSHRFEDALVVLESFHPRLDTGDYVVVEDGVLDQFSDLLYERYGNGPPGVTNRSS